LHYSQIEVLHCTAGAEVEIGPHCLQTPVGFGRGEGFDMGRSGLTYFEDN